MSTPTTTIRVPVATRDRLAAQARARGVSMATLLTELATRTEREAMFRAEQRVISAAADAYKQGRKDALSIDEPVHDDLEMACLSLWFSEQNLLYMQKNPTD